MMYFNEQMKNSYRLYKLSNSLLNKTDVVFQSLYNHILNNKNFKQFCENSKIIQKNNSFIMLYKFKKQLKYIDQIVLQFDVQNDDIEYDISVYTKQSAMDNKFYVTISNILNDSSKTFKADNNLLQSELKKYFSDVFDNYFQIYKQNVDNGLFV